MRLSEISQYEISYERDNYQCTVCGKPAIMQAHCIDNTKTNIKVYGKKIIENHNNLRSVCSLECNTKVRVSKVSQKTKLFNLISNNLFVNLYVDYMNKKIKE